MTICKGQHIGCPACMAYYLKHHANTCTYARMQDRRELTEAEQAHARTLAQEFKHLLP